MSEAAILRIVVSLVFVVALILAAAWATRRAGFLRGGSNVDLHVLGSRSLGGRAYVALIEVENARLVVGVTANHISLLHTLPRGEGSGKAMQGGNLPDGDAARGFAGALSKVMKRR
jgi:flagellar protein FliO/FliZ